MRLVLAALLLTAAVAVSSTAQPVEDDSFADGGFALVKIPDETTARAVTVLGDGAMLVAGISYSDGAVFVTRLLPDGSVDEAFGTDGVARLESEPGANHFSPSGIRELPDGRIVVAGMLSGPLDAPWPTFLYAAALEADGRPDTSFGDGGSLRRALDDDGPTVVLGLEAACGGLYVHGYASSYRTVGFVARLTTGGQFDASFGENGIAWTADFSKLNGLAVRPDCRSVAVGSVRANERFHYDVYATGLTVDGAPDPTFVTLQHDAYFEQASIALGVRLLDDGRALVSGWGDKGDDRVQGTMLYRLMPDGTRDPAFGFEGWTWTDAVPSNNGAGLDAPGAPVVTPTGYAVPVLSHGGRGLAVLGVDPAGAPDPTFGTDGIARLFPARDGLSTLLHTPAYTALSASTETGIVVAGTQTLSPARDEAFVARVRLPISTAAASRPPGLGAAAVSPNPVGTTARVHLDVQEASFVEVSVFDVLGRRVATLYDGPAPAGDLRAAWDASNVVPGIYVVRARVGGRFATRTVTVAR